MLGECYGTISKRSDIPWSTVQPIVQSKKNGSTNTFPGRGRKPNLILRLAMKIWREKNMNPGIWLRDITGYLKEQGIEISIRTIQ